LKHFVIPGIGCGYLHALLFARRHVGGPTAAAALPAAVFRPIIAQVLAEGARGADAAMEADIAAGRHLRSFPWYLRWRSTRLEFKTLSK